MIKEYCNANVCIINVSCQFSIISTIVPVFVYAHMHDCCLNVLQNLPPKIVYFSRTYVVEKDKLQTFTGKAGSGIGVKTTNDNDDGAMINICLFENYWQRLKSGICNGSVYDLYHSTLTDRLFISYIML